MKQGDFYWVENDDAKGSEIKKTRPCIIISPDVMNQHLKTVMIAPSTTVFRNYPWRVLVTSLPKQSQIMLDQVRAIDKSRLGKKDGKLSNKELKQCLQMLQKIFSDQHIK